MTTIPYANPAESKLEDGHRATLRDWYDEGGRWSEKISALYRLVEEMSRERAEIAWEQGWVARGNEWTVVDNPYRVQHTLESCRRTDCDPSAQPSHFTPRGEVSS